MKTLKLIATAITLATTALAPQAKAQNYPGNQEMGRVISSIPVMQQVAVPRQVCSLEQVVVPRLRSAVRLNFAVRSGQAALVTVLLKDGQPAPAGAEIERMGDARRFPVGRGGQAFVTGLQAEQPLRLHWNGTSCLMALVLPPGSADDIARPKPLVCEGVSP